MQNKRILPYATNFFTLGILFDVAKDGTDVNFFKDKAPAGCVYEVMINSQPTEQSYDSISFKAGDYVLIRLLQGDKFPWFDASNTDYIARVKMPLPTLSRADGSPVTDMTGCFKGNTELVSITQELFANNPSVTVLDDCFANCSKLTIGITENEIPIYPEDQEGNPMLDAEPTETEIVREIVNIGLPQTVSSAVGFASNNKAIGTVFVSPNTKTATAFNSELSINTIEE